MDAVTLCIDSISIYKTRILYTYGAAPTACHSLTPQTKTPARGVFSLSRVTKFWEFSNSLGFDKHIIVYIGVVDPAESKSGLIFELDLLLHCYFGYFCQRLERILKN